jgi:hypothetical protein
MSSESPVGVKAVSQPAPDRPVDRRGRLGPGCGSGDDIPDHYFAADPACLHFEHVLYICALDDGGFGHHFPDQRALVPHYDPDLQFFRKFAVWTCECPFDDVDNYCIGSVWAHAAFGAAERVFGKDGDDAMMEDRAVRGRWRERARALGCVAQNNLL